MGLIVATANFYLTNAGKAAALDAEANSIDIQITHLAVGTAKYDGQVAAPAKTSLTTEIARYGVAGGGVNGNVLRLTTTITPLFTAEIFEIGLFLSDGTLFAVAAVTGTDPLMQAANGLTSVITLGCSLADVGSNVTVSVDANSPIAVVLMNQHIENSDPHPQYSKKIDTDAALLALKVTTITAGAGLTGGGDLSENRTVTLGTPSTITGTTTNSVTADSHTHEIEFPEGVDISGKYDKTGGELNGNILLKGYLELTGGRTVAKLYAADFLRLELNHPLLINDAVNVSNVVAATDLTVSDNGSTSITHSNIGIEGNFVRFSSSRDKYVFDKPVQISGNGGGWLEIMPNDNYMDSGFCNFFTNSNIFNFDGKNVFFGITSAISQDGYTSLPNGHILQWGRYDRNDNGGEGGVDITFPIAFRVACYVVDLTRLTASPSGDNSDGGISLYNTSPNGFSAHLSTFYGGSVGSLRGFTWIAIGY